MIDRGPEPGRQPRAEDRHGGEGQGQRPGLQAGAQRGLAQAVLEQQRQHEHEAAEEEHQGEVQGRAGRERPVAEQRQVEQRLAAAAGQPPLPGQREREDRGAGRQAGPGPGGPALVVAQGQRHQRQRHRSRYPGRAGRVQPGPAEAAGPRHHQRGGDQRGRAHRDVHQEDRAPAQAQHVGLQQQAAEDLAGHEGQPHRDAEPGQRPAPLAGRERRGDQREDLRHHGRAGQPLQQPGADQFRGGPGQPAQQRGDGEAGHAGHEHPPVPRQVTQPPAGTMPLAYMNAYPPTISCSAASLTCKSRCSDGPATFTTQISKPAMNIASSTTGSISQRREPGGDAVSVTTLP